ncbi:MAG: hypothetical protein KBA66_23100 [Leptospiraceae bacterium]|nr:hypothetical protein [Leptospiraceae bacterium]
MKQKKAKQSNPKQTGIPVHSRDNFLAIPNEIIRFLYKFSGNEIKVLLYLLVTRNLKDKKYGLVKEIAIHTGFHPNTVYSIVRSLKEKGIVHSRRVKSGNLVFINFFKKDISFKKVFEKVGENIASGIAKLFPGIRYLYFKDEDNRDSKNSTQLDNFFTSFLIRIPGTENSFTLDSSERSIFRELTGNHLKLLLFFKYLSQFKDCLFFKAAYVRIEKATGIKRTTISKLLNELCDKYQIIGRENYMKNRKRYFFNYRTPDGVLTSVKRAAQKAKSILTKFEVQNDQVSQKTDFLCTKQITNLIKDISEKKSFETSATSKSSETVTQIETTIVESRVDDYKELSIKKISLPNPSEPIKEKEIDSNFLEELKRLRPGYHHQPNVT